MGALAAIERHHGFKDGRSLILVKGMGRFAIHDGLESGEPYYEAVVADYEDEPGQRPELTGRRQASIDLFRDAVSALQRPSSASPDLDADTGGVVSIGRVRASGPRVAAGSVGDAQRGSPPGATRRDLRTGDRAPRAGGGGMTMSGTVLLQVLRLAACRITISA